MSFIVSLTYDELELISFTTSSSLCFTHWLSPYGNDSERTHFKLGARTQVITPMHVARITPMHQRTKHVGWLRVTESYYISSNTNDKYVSHLSNMMRGRKISWHKSSCRCSLFHKKFQPTVSWSSNLAAARKNEMDEADLEYLINYSTEHITTKPIWKSDLESSIHFVNSNHIST